MNVAYPVEYFSDPEPKAFAKGGKIHISSGMVRRVTGPELQAVILHETGHMEREHSIDKFACHLVPALACIALLLIDIPVNLKAACLGAVSVFWVYGAQWTYHWCEFDADAYVVQAGYGRDFARFLCKIVPDHRQRTFSHPSIVDRVLRIYEKA
jgi:Zn-dependent protease with chaperone function